MDLALSISTRLWLSAVAIVIALSAMAGAVGYTVRIAMAVTGAGNQARAVVMNAELVLSDLRDAETGQRGYIITGTERYLVPYERAIAEIDQRLAQLKSDTGGDSLLAPKAARLEELAATKLRELAQSIALRRDQGFEPAQRFVVEGTGIDLMNRARGLTDEIDTVEQRVLNDLDTELAAANLRLLGLLLLGTPGVAGCAVLAIWTAIRSLKAPLTALERGVHRIGNGNLTEPIPIEGNDELAGLARAFNAMMDDLRTERAIRLEAEGAVRLSNEALAARSEQLERRTGTIDLLGRMANRLPGCISEIELVQVVERYAPQLLGIPGALYIFSNSLMILRTIATWGGQGGSVPEFPPADCWGLRRGQPHLIDDVTADVVCAHVSPDGLVG